MPRCLNIENVMKRLRDSELAFSVSAYLDNKVRVQLGTYEEGFCSKTDVDTFQEAAIFLNREAIEYYPESVYAMGNPGMPENKD